MSISLYYIATYHNDRQNSGQQPAPVIPHHIQSITLLKKKPDELKVCMVYLFIL